MYCKCHKYDTINAEWHIYVSAKTARKSLFFTGKSSIETSVSHDMYQWQSLPSTGQICLPVVQSVRKQLLYFKRKCAMSFSSVLQLEERLECHELAKEGLHIFMWYCVKQHIFIITDQGQERAQWVQTCDILSTGVTCSHEESGLSPRKLLTSLDWMFKLILPLKSAFVRSNGLKARKYCANFLVYVQPF